MYSWPCLCCNIIDDCCSRTGYQLSFLDRRELIQLLYDNLRDKTRVLVGKELVEIEYRVEEVRVLTKDGAVYEGSIVVGADGVHSRTRSEMSRLASISKGGLSKIAPGNLFLYGKPEEQIDSFSLQI